MLPLLLRRHKTMYFEQVPPVGHHCLTNMSYPIRTSSSNNRVTHRPMLYTVRYMSSQTVWISCPERSYVQALYHDEQLSVGQATHRIPKGLYGVWQYRLGLWIKVDRIFIVRDGSHSPTSSCNPRTSKQWGNCYHGVITGDSAREWRKEKIAVIYHRIAVWNLHKNFNNHPLASLSLVCYRTRNTWQ